MRDGSVFGRQSAPLRRALHKREGVPFLPDGHVDVAACAIGLSRQGRAAPVRAARFIQGGLPAG